MPCNGSVMLTRPEMTDKGHRVSVGFIENAVINTQSTTGRV